MEKWGLLFGKLVPKVKPKDQIKTWRILRGDIVEVIKGPLEGSKGKVIEVRQKENKVFIEGVNIIMKKVEGQVYNIEQGIHASKVALLDPIKKVPTKINWGYVEDSKANNGYRRTRISKISGIEIPKPPPPIRERVAGQFDTKAEDVLQVTFKPSLEVSPIPKDCVL